MIRKVSLSILLLGVASLFAIAGPEKPRNHVGPPVWEEPHRGYSLSSGAGVGGIWVSPKSVNGPYGALYTSIRDNVSVLGFSRNGQGNPHDFAIVAEKDGVRFQVVDEKGVPHSIPATALLKLVDVEHVVADKPKTSDTPVAPVAGAITEDHKFLYSLARTKAVTEYARVNKVSRSVAREKVDSLDDATLHAAVVKSGAFKIVAMPVGGKLTDFLDWISSHSDQILALVKLIMSLLAFI